MREKGDREEKRKRQREVFMMEGNRLSDKRKVIRENCRSGNRKRKLWWILPSSAIISSASSVSCRIFCFLSHYLFVYLPVFFSPSLLSSSLSVYCFSLYSLIDFCLFFPHFPSPLPHIPIPLPSHFPLSPVISFIFLSFFFLSRFQLLFLHFLSNFNISRKKNGQW